MKNLIVRETARVNANTSEVNRALKEVKTLSKDSPKTGNVTPNLFYKIMKNAIIIF